MRSSVSTRLLQFCCISTLVCLLDVQPLRAGNERNRPKDMIGEVIDAIDQVFFIEGKFSYREAENGVTKLQLRGDFKILRNPSAPPCFEINYFDEQDRKIAKLISDGEQITAISWKPRPGTTDLRPNEESSPEVRSSGVFRGGSAFLQKSGYGVAAHYLQNGYFDIVKYYKPAQEKNNTGQIVFKIAIPSTAWNYKFGAKNSQLIRLEIETSSDDTQKLQVTEYTDLKIRRWGEAVDDNVSKLLKAGNADFKVTVNDPLESLLGKSVCDIEVEWNDEVKGTLADKAGRIIVIDFWASWCGPCLKELPSVIDLSQSYAENNVVFICSPWKDRRANADATASRMGFESLVHRVASGDFALEKTGIPCTFVIDRTGEIRDFIVGSHGEAGKRHLREIIDAALSDHRRTDRR